MAVVRTVGAWAAWAACAACAAGAATDWGPHSQVVEALHGTFVLPKGDSIVSQYLRDWGQFETPLISFAIDLLELFEPSQPTIVLDIGANVGAWTVPLAKAAGPDGQVFAFEPQRHLVAHLGATIVANGLANVHTVHCVVGNVSGVAPINDFSAFSSFSANFGGLSMLGDLVFAQPVGISTRSVVPVVKLDDFFAQQMEGHCPKLIKMDIEHYELYALLGAQHMLLECHPVILLEANCPLLNRSLFALLDRLGYRMAWVRAPVLDHSVAFQGRRQDLAQFAAMDEATFNVFFFGAINVVAIPKRMDFAGLVARLPHLLFPIDPTSGRFTVEEYDLSYCIRGLDTSGQAKCGRFYMHGEPPEAWESRDGHRVACGGSRIPDFMVDYWRRLD